MDMSLLRGLATVSAFLAFIGVCWWVYTPHNRKRFDEAASLPFEGEVMSGNTKNREKTQ